MEYSGHTLELDSGCIHFPDKINEVVKVEDGYIVQFQTLGKGESYDDESDSRNVWKVNTDGSVCWKIERADKFADGYDPFTGLWKEGDEIWAYNYNGLAYRINADTGELGETRQMK